MLIVAWIFALFFSPSVTYWDYCKDMNDWKLCLDIKSNHDYTYKMEKIFYPKVQKNNYMLNCTIDLPDWKQKDLSTCDWEFTYYWYWKGKIRIYVYLEWERTVINTEHNFINLNDKQLEDAIDLKNMWDDAMEALISKYPELKDSEQWILLRDVFHENLLLFIEWKDWYFQSYEMMKNTFLQFIKFTKELVG